MKKAKTGGMANANKDPKATPSMKKGGVVSKSAAPFKKGGATKKK